jgi:hypothetical protein
MSERCNECGRTEIAAVYYECQMWVSLWWFLNEDEYGSSMSVFGVN